MLVARGLNYCQIAYAVGVHRDLFNQWQRAFPGFSGNLIGANALAANVECVSRGVTATIRLRQCQWEQNLFVSRVHGCFTCDWAFASTSGN